MSEKIRFDRSTGDGDPGSSDTLEIRYEQKNGNEQRRLFRSMLLVRNYRAIPPGTGTHVPALHLVIGVGSGIAIGNPGGRGLGSSYVGRKSMGEKQNPLQHPLAGK